MAALSLFVGIALATGFLTPPGSTASPAASATTVVKGPSASVTFDASGGWVADDTAGTVRRFNPTTGSWTSKPAPVGNAAVSIAAGFDKVWAVSALANTVVGVDASSGTTNRSPVGVAAGPVSVAAGDGGVWVASLEAGTVSLVDPTTFEVEASVALPDGAVRVALGDGSVWVTGQTDSLTRINPTPVGVTLRWESVDRRPRAHRRGRRRQGGLGGRRTERDGERGRSEEPAGRTHHCDPVADPTGGDPDTVAVWDGLVWVGDGATPIVSAFDPGTGRQVGARVAVPGVVRQLVVGDGNLWAATANPGRVVRLSRVKGLQPSWTSSMRVPRAPLGCTKATVVPLEPGRGASSMRRPPACRTAASAVATSVTR